MSRTRLLVVDDEPAVLDLVVCALSTQGYEVVAVPSPAQALELAKVPPYFDLLLSDVNMPGLRGPELAEQIAQACPSIAVVLMSGQATRQALPEGARFVSKPLLLTELYSRVESALKAAAVGHAC